MFGQVPAGDQTLLDEVSGTGGTNRAKIPQDDE